jgi:uncharacterized protein YbbK (DUF523 family)
MQRACLECGHRLWEEARCVGAFRFVVYFDEDEESASYAEHVKLCPECGVGLGGGKYLRSPSRIREESKVKTPPQ